MYSVITTIVSACKLQHWGWVGASNNDPAQRLHTLKSGPAYSRIWLFIYLTSTFLFAPVTVSFRQSCVLSTVVLIKEYEWINECAAQMWCLQCFDAVGHVFNVFFNFYLNVFTSVSARVCVSVRSWVSSSDGRHPESQLPGPLRRAARLRVEHHPAGRTPDLPQRHRLRARNQPRLHQRLSRDQVSEWVSEWVRGLV